MLIASVIPYEGVKLEGCGSWKTSSLQTFFTAADQMAMQTYLSAQAPS